MTQNVQKTAAPGHLTSMISSKTFEFGSIKSVTSALSSQRHFFLPSAEAKIKLVMATKQAAGLTGPAGVLHLRLHQSGRYGY